MGLCKCWASALLAVLLIARILMAGEPELGKEALEKGKFFMVKGNFDSAIAAYTDAIRLNPTLAEAYHERGLAFGVGKGDENKAIADYSEAIRLRPDFALAYYGRGVAWGIKREYDKAISDCTEAIRLDPKLAEAYGDRGRGHYQKGENDKAIADFGGGIEAGQVRYWQDRRAGLTAV